MADILRIGVIGAGRIGTIHAHNISRFIPFARLEGVADLRMNGAMEHWAKDLGARVACTHPGDLISDPSIDAVAICSSTDTHAEFIIAAADAGKHIFCEKPIDLNLDKVQTAITSAQRAGVKLQIGFNRRFDHNFAGIKKHILAGTIGQMHILKITSRDPAPPPPDYIAASGGIFLDMMTHDFDMARFLAGSEIVEVYAAGEVLIDPNIGKVGDIDTAVVTLRFAGGAMGIIDNSRKAAYGYDQRVEAFGSAGAVIAENDIPNTVKLYNASGVTTEKPLYFFLERYQGSFVEEMTAFADAVVNDKPVPVSGEDGLSNMLAALAAGKSLREGRPVKIAEVQ